MYADDTALAAQGNSFHEVERKLTNALNDLATYYEHNFIRPNLAKTQVFAFHLCNREAKRQMNIVWGGQQLEHYPTPKYLGVTLNQALTYKRHCLNNRKKVSTRNNLLQNGVHPITQSRSTSL